MNIRRDLHVAPTEPEPAVSAAPAPVSVPAEPAAPVPAAPVPAPAPVPAAPEESGPVLEISEVSSDELPNLLMEEQQPADSGDIKVVTISHEPKK